MHRRDLKRLILFRREPSANLSSFDCASGVSAADGDTAAETITTHSKAGLGQVQSVFQLKGFCPIPSVFTLRRLTWTEV